MITQEKAAWRNLAVVLLMLVAYFALLLLTGNPHASLVAFALMALLSLRAKPAMGKKGNPAGDERDQLIALKALTVSFRIFWLYFVGYCMVAVRFWDYRESVPSYLFLMFLLTGMCVMVGTQAIATLVLYRADAVEHQTMAVRYRNMSGMRKSGLWMMLIAILAIVPLMIMMLKIGHGEFPLRFGYLVCGGLVVVYLLTRHYLGKGVSTDEEAAELSWVRRKGDITLLVSCVAVVFSLGLVWVIPLDMAALQAIAMIFLMGLTGAWLALGFSAFLSGTGMSKGQSASPKEQQNA